MMMPPLRCYRRKNARLSTTQLLQLLLQLCNHNCIVVIDMFSVTVTFLNNWMKFRLGFTL